MLSIGGAIMPFAEGYSGNGCVIFDSGNLFWFLMPKGNVLQERLIRLGGAIMTNVRTVFEVRFQRSHSD